MDVPLRPCGFPARPESARFRTEMLAALFCCEIQFSGAKSAITPLASKPPMPELCSSPQAMSWQVLTFNTFAEMLHTVEMARPIKNQFADASQRRTGAEDRLPAAQSKRRMRNGSSQQWLVSRSTAALRRLPGRSCYGDQNTCNGGLTGPVMARKRPDIAINRKVAFVLLKPLKLRY